ncbi:MAG: zinc ribbon domain-containing protein [Clostridia bacterium]|nr:zinc ribbon domain-containing protein [Clostridia bacterium]
MKHCPFCKAELEENARFCLYCMTPLDEKQVIPTRIPQSKRRLLTASAVLLFVLCAVLGAVCFGSKPDPTLPANGTTTTTTAAITESGNTTVSHSGGTVSTDKTGTSSTENIGANTTVGTNGTSQSMVASQSSSTVNSQSGSGSSQSSNRSSQSTSSSAKPSAEESRSTTASTAANTDAVYRYRAAVQGDDHNVSYIPPDNAVVITGVAKASSNGVYNIPAMIDGKTVVGILNEAFWDESIRDTVKVVIVPDTVRTVGKAFTASYHLTDIYLRGNVYIDRDAFPPVAQRNGTLTIHSSADCTNRDFWKYSAIAEDYGAVWAEWDGVL